MSLDGAVNRAARDACSVKRECRDDHIAFISYRSAMPYRSIVRPSGLIKLVPAMCSTYLASTGHDFSFCNISFSQGAVCCFTLMSSERVVPEHESLLVLIRRHRCLLLRLMEGN